MEALMMAVSFYVAPIDVDNNIIGEKERCRSEKEARKLVISALDGGRAFFNGISYQIRAGSIRRLLVVKERPTTEMLGEPVHEYDAGAGFHSTIQEALIALADASWRRSWFFMMWKPGVK